MKDTYSVLQGNGYDHKRVNGITAPWETVMNSVGWNDSKL